MADRNRFQLAAAVETSPGTETAVASLYAAANAKLLLGSVPELSTTPEIYERQAVRPSLTPLSPLAGAVDCTLSFSTELAGTTDGTGIPEWSKLMEACGWRRVTVYGYTIGAISTGSPAAFHSGETLTATATATCLFDTVNGETTLYVYDQSGTLASATVTGSTSGSTATISASLGDLGEAWVPTSETESSCTITGYSATIDEGDVLVGGTSSARIVATRATWANGTVYFRYIEGGPLTASETLTNQTQTGSCTYDSAEAQVKMPTLTIGVIEDAVRRTIIGARGKFSVRVNAVGEPAIVDWEFKGRLHSTPNSDGVEIPSVTRNAQVPPAFIGATVRVGAPSDAYTAEVSPRALGFSFDLSSTATVSKDATTSDGLSGAARHRSRACTGTLNLGVAAEGTFPWLAKIQGADPVRVAITLPSTATGNTIKMQAPAFIPTGGDGAEDEGDALRNVTGSLSGQNPEGADADDREFIIALLD